LNKLEQFKQILKEIKQSMTRKDLRNGEKENKCVKKMKSFKTCIWSNNLRLSKKEWRRKPESLEKEKWMRSGENCFLINKSTKLYSFNN